MIRADFLYLESLSSWGWPNRVLIVQIDASDGANVGCVRIFRMFCTRSVPYMHLVLTLTLELALAVNENHPRFA